MVLPSLMPLDKCLILSWAKHDSLGFIGVTVPGPERIMPFRWLFMTSRTTHLCKQHVGFLCVCVLKETHLRDPAAHF